MTARTTVMRPPLAEEIIRTVAHITGIRPEDITGPNRCEPYTNWRKIAVVELRGAGYSLKEVGRMLNGRHHATIIQATQTYHNYYQTWPEFRIKADACAAAVAALTEPEKIYLTV